MIIDLPVRFGETIELIPRFGTKEKKMYVFSDMYWTKSEYTGEYSFTYFFDIPNPNMWVNTSISMEHKDIKEYAEHMEIDESLTEDCSLKEQGYPLRGKGRIVGFRWMYGRLYAAFNLVSHPGFHVCCECDDKAGTTAEEYISRQRPPMIHRKKRKELCLRPIRTT